MVLIEPSVHVGGMISGGLSRTDFSNERIIGGMAREFFTRADAAYNDPEKTGGPAFSNSEPHVAERVFLEMIREAGIRLVTGESLRAGRREGSRLMGLETRDGVSYVGVDGGMESRSGVNSAG